MVSIASSDATVRIVGNHTGGHAGASLGSLGDMDGDGREDIFCEALNSSGDESHAGFVYIFYAPEPGTYEGAFDADAYVYGDTESQMVGYPGSGAGDVDGDGCPDLLLGAAGEERGRGAAYLLLGG